MMLNRIVFDETFELAENAMLTNKPELIHEWNFKKNDELGLNVYTITKGMRTKVWWNCHKCGNTYDASVANKVMGRNCSFCKGFKVNDTNSLKTMNPSLASEWHPTLNEGLTPDDVTANRRLKAWWSGECGHEWEAYIYSRNVGVGCPYCASRQILIGFNDMWTINPNMASMLVSPDDGFKYMQSSNKRTDWKCIDCNTSIKNKSPANVFRQGISCPVCSDGISYPQKLIGAMLSNLRVEFKPEKTFSWSKRRRYDFYLPDYNCIIEAHGMQHYKEVTGMFGLTTLKEEEDNDSLKRELAKNNNIQYYVELDCRKSDLKYITDSVSQSELKEILQLDDINWEVVGQRAIKSKIVEACEVYELQKDNLTSKNISVILGIGYHTLLKYLKLGSEVGLCDFKVNNMLSKANSQKQKFRKVVQLSLTGKFIKEFSSIKSAASSLKVDGIENAKLSSNLKGTTKQSYGFIWMYTEDYCEYLLGKRELYNVKERKENPKKRKIVQLSTDGKLIKEWESIARAAQEFNVNISAIFNACKDIKRTSKGYRWMYKDSYNTTSEQDLQGMKELYIKVGSSKRIVQLSKNDGFINEFDSIKEALNSLDLGSSSTGISVCCKGRQKTAYGFKWMYKEDYSRLVNKL
jgi:hypothetical protein